ncbi:MAG: surE [Clostridia bacterium]|jgi:5'-nucleotidase|nr:surE [Clostridia bacterium]
MRILITNDDGIYARGIQVLAKEIAQKHEVIIVAPREQKSASSHSISIHEPIRVREEKLDGLQCKAYSVVGTPADCTQMGVSLLAGQVDLVLSGINRGLNCGTDILYSGTVSAAIEGAIYNIPSIAVSMEVDWEKEDETYEKAARWASRVIDTAVAQNYLRKNIVLNLNIPHVPEDKVKGVKVCKLGKSTYQTEYVLVEEHDDKVYTIKGTRNKIEEEDSDLYYISQGYVTLTPLHFDFTDFKMMNQAEEYFDYTI